MSQFRVTDYKGDTIVCENGVVFIRFFINNNIFSDRYICDGTPEIYERVEADAVSINGLLNIRKIEGSIFKRVKMIPEKLLSYEYKAVPVGQVVAKSGWFTTKNYTLRSYIHHERDDKFGVPLRVYFWATDHFRDVLLFNTRAKTLDASFYEAPFSMDEIRTACTAHAVLAVTPPKTKVASWGGHQLVLFRYADKDGLYRYAWFNIDRGTVHEYVIGDRVGRWLTLFPKQLIDYDNITKDGQEALDLTTDRNYFATLMAGHKASFRSDVTADSDDRHPIRRRADPRNDVRYIRADEEATVARRDTSRLHDVRTVDADERTPVANPVSAPFPLTARSPSDVFTMLTAARLFNGPGVIPSVAVAPPDSPSPARATMSRFPEPVADEPLVTDNEKLCAVCLSRRSVVCCVPCGHVCSCVTCCIEIKNKSMPMKCPLCRADVMLYQKTYN